MTRRGPRSIAAIIRRNAASVRHEYALEDSRTGGVIRWETSHGIGMTFISADCANCHRPRLDLDPQRCNLHHPTSRPEAEAVILGAASYAACEHCGSSAISLQTLREHEDAEPGLLHATVEELGPEAILFRRGLSN